ncbi:helix-turn-helix domain-containing protein [Neobacillus rhizosphaerae]|uniref:helix-turn-helix domain-containing protein n=1 Tax=Neobacillus rhizosphaerae TaxID=2880965 RepID=UPI003D2C81A4
MASTIKKTYSDTFKLSVVKYALEINNFSATARKFKLCISTVRRWVNKYQSQIENDLNTLKLINSRENNSADPQPVTDIVNLTLKNNVFIIQK